MDSQRNVELGLAGHGTGVTSGTLWTGRDVAALAETGSIPAAATALAVVAVFRIISRREMSDDCFCIVFAHFVDGDDTHEGVFERKFNAPQQKFHVCMMSTLIWIKKP
jgi:hypothetical protein